MCAVSQVVAAVNDSDDDDDDNLCVSFALPVVIKKTKT
jgi:hypothetical protein